MQTISDTRKVSAVVADRICRTVLDQNSEELYGAAIAEARKHVGKRIDARVASFDLSFSDPKSVSLLAAGSSPEVRAEVQAARHVAIRKVLGWLEQEAVGVRRGHNGIDRYRGSGITAAAFDHRTSREGDPQWHTHVLVQNATLGPDGRWSALDSRKLYAHAMTADRLGVVPGGGEGIGTPWGGVHGLPWRTPLLQVFALIDARSRPSAANRCGRCGILDQGPDTPKGLTRCRRGFAQDLAGR